MQLPRMGFRSGPPLQWSLPRLPELALYSRPTSRQIPLCHQADMDEEDDDIYEPSGAADEAALHNGNRVKQDEDREDEDDGEEAGDGSDSVKRPGRRLRRGTADTP